MVRQRSSVMSVTFSSGWMSQAGRDCVARAGSELGGELCGAEVWCCLCCLINHDVHLFCNACF